MTPEVLAEIDAAVAFVADLLRTVPAEVRYELRQDLRQELALKLVRGKLRVAGLRVAARHWLLNEFRDHARARELEAEYVAGVGRRYRADAYWLPTWYPPHVDATEHPPFACEGARMMHVKSGESYRDVPGATVDFIASKRPSR